MADQFIGRRVNVGVARETTRGTHVAPTYWEPNAELTFDDKVELADTSSRFGVIADASDSFVVGRYAQGNIKGEINDISFGLFLYGLMGTLSSAVRETTAYNHTFTISQTNNHQSLSFRVEDPIGTVDFPLVMIDSLTIDVTLGEVVMYEATFISKTSKDSSGTKSYTFQNRFLPTHMNFKLAANLASLGAASTIDIKHLSITFSKNVVRDHALGTPDPIDIFNQQMSVEGTLELDYKDRTYRDYFKLGTYRAMRIDLINTATTIGASSNPELQINLPRVRFHDWESVRPLDDISTQTVSFKALEDVSGSNNIISSIVLTNTATSY